MNFHTLTNYLDSLNKNYNIPGGEIIICKEHETVYHHNFGYKDYYQKVPSGTDDVYMFFSASKVITMTAVLQLVEQGKISLYDELSKFFPEYSTLLVANEFEMKFPTKWPDKDTPCHHAHETIRIIDLMSMTAGLSYDTDSEPLKELKTQSKDQATTEEVISCIAKMPLIYEPRTRWSYSLSHDVLGGIIERVSGLKFSTYLKKYIFDPLEIKDMTFYPETISKERYAAFYQGEIGPDFTFTTAVKPYPQGYENIFRITKNYESGGAGLWGTAGNYSKFADALSNGGVGFNGNRILSEESVRLFTIPYTTGQMLTDFRQSGKTEYGYGLGVRVHNEQGDNLSPIGEFGWDGAAGAYVMIDPFNKISIFYTQHIFGYPLVYSEIHPKIRDLAYKSILY